MTIPLFTRRRRIVNAAALVTATVLVLSACSGSESGSSTDSDDGDESAEVAPVSVSTNVKQGAKNVSVDKELNVTAEGGTITEVRVTAPKQRTLKGKVSDDGAQWSARSGVLEPGVRYTMKTTVENSEGEPETTTSRFTTRDLSLDEQTFASVAPLDGETVGVGMPVVVNFDIPVKNKAAFEKRMTVDVKPTQEGTWNWLSDTEAHWRPKSYWKPGSKVSVNVGVNSISAGNGIYGQENRKLDFKVGDANIYKIDTRSHQMKVFSNGKLLRTLPVTTGKQPAFTTRSGIKVIMEKNSSRRMRSETVGIAANSSEGYDLDDVRWAMRITTSGEFIHAAPWSVGSQGVANVSHGCTGLSTADAGWLYSMTQRGDVVETVGTNKPMERGNGYADWNESWAQYQKGSALS